MERKLFVTMSAAVLAGAPAAARAQITARQTLTLAPENTGETATYRFTVPPPPPTPDMQGSGPPKNPPKPPDPRIDVIAFTFVDATHVRLSTGTGSDEKTALADRGLDGRLRGRFGRGTPFGPAVQMYNRLLSVSSVATSTAPGETKSGGIPMGFSDDAIPGTLHVDKAGDTTNVIIDARGPVNAPGGPGRGGPPGGGFPGGGPPGGGGFPGGGGPPGGGPAGPGGPDMPQANAVLHADVRYVNGLFVRAQGTETITLDGPGKAMSMKRDWSVEKV